MVPVSDESGKSKQRWYSGYRTRRAAQRALTELLSRLEGGTFIEPSKQTLGQYLTEWLHGLRASGLKPSSISGYEMLATKHIIPALGGVLLQKITAAQLNALYADMLDHGRRTGKGRGGPLSASTVKYAHVTVRKALGDAVKVGVLSRNVADQASPPRPTARPRQATWTAEELRRILEHVADERAVRALPSSRQHGLATGRGARPALAGR